MMLLAWIDHLNLNSMDEVLLFTAQNEWGLGVGSALERVYDPKSSSSCSILGITFSAFLNMFLLIL